MSIHSAGHGKRVLGNVAAIGGIWVWLLRLTCPAAVLSENVETVSRRAKEPEENAENKTPRVSFEARGDLIWQRPTFAGPIAQLSSAQQRFTSVFGMGTGGTTVPWSPDFDSHDLE